MLQQSTTIIEIGSAVIKPGPDGLRSIFNKPAGPTGPAGPVGSARTQNYIGFDMDRAPGVDYVLSDPYVIPMPDNSCNVVLCSSVLEHSDMYWVLFMEMVRVLKPGGLLYIQVPSNAGVWHRFPIDSWRFQADAGLSLEKWAKYNGQDIVLMESFVGEQDPNDGEIWNDFVAVFVKGSEHTSYFPKRITDSITDYTNAYVFEDKVNTKQYVAVSYDLRRRELF
jgi:SAM-dependent methyltransferase